MNPDFSRSHPPRPLPADEEAAALWAARLDGGGFSPSDRHELEAWLEGHPERATLLASYGDFSVQLEHEIPALAASGALALPADAEASRGHDSHGEGSRSGWKLWLSGAALAGAAAVAVFLATGPGAPTQRQAEHFTVPVAQRQELALADGSIVKIFPQTHIAVEIDGSHRHVKLSGGEAFFTVAKDSARPFIVETEAGSVRVTGTEFNVRNTPGSGLEVIVAHGSVLVQPSGPAAAHLQPVALTAGSKLSTTLAGAVSVETLSTPALENALAWRGGQIVLDSTPLAEAVATFARYHGRIISVQDSVAALGVGGRYSLDDLDGFFTDLEKFLPVKTKRLASGAVHISARPATEAEAVANPSK